MEGEGSSFPNGMPDDSSSSDSDNDTPAVVKIMKDVIPKNATVSEEAKDLIENCVVEFIAFVTKEANKQCEQEDREMVTSEDIISAMSRLGFDDYAELLTNCHNQIHGEGIVAAAVSTDEDIIVDGPIGHGDDETDNGDENESDDGSV